MIEAASLVVAESAGELLSRLVHEHDFEERPLQNWEFLPRVVPDGVYLAPCEGGFSVWVPPDPETASGSWVLPKIVKVMLSPHARGHALTLLRQTPRTNLLALGGTAFFVLLATVLPLALGAAPITLHIAIFLPLCLLVSWVVLGEPYRDARERSELAWRAITRAVGPLAISGELEEDPYRGE